MSRDILESKHGECRSFVCSKYIGPFTNVQRFSNVCNLKKITETLQYILASTTLDTINTCPLSCYRGNIVSTGKILYSSCVISPSRG